MLGQLYQWSDGRRKGGSGFDRVLHDIERTTFRRLLGELEASRWDAVVHPASRLDQHVARVQRWLSSGAILEALATGRCTPPVGLRPRHRPELARSLDHLGINYYGRYLVRFNAGRPAMYLGHHVQTPTIRTETSDWGQPSARACSLRSPTRSGSAFRST